MRYSILVAIYNVEKYLRECLDSLQSQTIKDYEVILVDDGSKDSSGSICDEYAQQDSRFKVIHKANGGLMTARKAGLAAAQGDYVCFVDGDDFVSPDFLHCYEEVLCKKETDIICTGHTDYTEGKEKTVHVKPACGFYNKEQLIRDIYPRMLSEKPFFSFYIVPSICLKCFRRSLIEPIYEIVPDEISIGEDASISFPALLRAESVYIMDGACYRYRLNPNSMTHSYDSGLYEKILILIKHIKKNCVSPFCNMEKQVNDFIAFLTYLAGANEIIYNRTNSIWKKRNNMLRYLKDEDIKKALRQVDLHGAKYRFMPFCLKHHLLFPLLAAQSIRK